MDSSHFAPEGAVDDAEAAAILHARLIKEVSAASGPQAFVDLLIGCRELRTAEFLRDLRIAAASPQSTSGLRTVAAFLASIHDMVKAARRVRTLGELAELGANYDLVPTAQFVPLIQVFDSTSTEVLALRGEANRLVGLLNLTDLSRFDGVPPELVEDSFLDWLCVLTDQEDDRETARGYRARIERLEFIGRWRRAAPPLELRGRNAGHVRINTPIPASMSEAWFLGAGAELRARSPALTEAFFLGRRSWRDTVKEAQAVCGLSLVSPASAAAFVACALLRNALDGASAAHVSRCLQQFRRVLDQAPMNALPTPERNSYALRYALALLPNVGALDDCRAILEDLVLLLSRVVEETSAEGNPGLMRDALLARARSRRELARWAPMELERAVADFRAALNVRGVRYEREARGRALGDLAGALMSVTHPAATTEREIERLFTEASSWCDGFPASRAVVLRNHAVLLVERVHGDRAVARERALQLINLALEELGAVNGPPEGELLWIQELRAVVLQTRGNILRAREGGSEAENWRDAISSYQAALTALVLGASPGLRSDIRFCIATAYLDEGSPESIAQAHLNLNEALRLADSPSQTARTVRLLADIFLRSPGEEGLAEHLGAVEAALEHFEDVDDSEQQARTMETLADLLLIRPDAFARERAARLLARAAQLFESIGDLFREAQALSDFSSVRLSQWRDTPGGKDLLAEASSAIDRAAGRLERLFRANVAPVIRHRLLEQIGALRAEHLWTQAQLGKPAATLWVLSAAQMQPELEAAQRVQSVGGRLQPSAAEAMLLSERLLGVARGEYARARMRAPPTIDLTERLVAIQEAQRELADALSVASLDSQSDQPSPVPVQVEQELRIEFHVALSGTVVLCAGPELPSEGLVLLLPFSGADLIRLLGVPESGRLLAWRTVYAQRAQAPADWERTWVEILVLLNQELIEPVRNAAKASLLLRPALALVPGALGELPLHAIPDSSGAPWFETTAAFVTLPASRFAERRRSRPRRPIRNALCVLSNPNSGGQDHLRWVASEIVECSAAGF